MTTLVSNTIKKAFSKTRTACAATVLGLLSACAHVDPVNVDYQPGYDFSQIKGFYWFKSPTGEEVHSLDDRRIRQAISDSLSSKGYQVSDEASEQNLAIAFHIDIQQRVDVDTVYNNWGYHPWYPWALNINEQTIVREYKAGNLVIDIIDPQTKFLVWQGSLEDEDKKLPPEQREQKLRGMVQEILAKFPPTVTTSN